MTTSPIQEEELTTPNDLAHSTEATSKQQDTRVEALDPACLLPQHQINLWRLVIKPSIITPEVWHAAYPGHGTENEPFVVDFLPNDPLNPQNWPGSRKWFCVAIVAIATLGVSYCTSAYLSALPQLREHFNVSDQIITLGLSFFILGFALGPLLWGPLSEEYGRQPCYIGTYTVLTLFNIGVTVSNSISTIIVLRFFAGAFGASPLANSGGVVADMFRSQDRGVGIAAWSACAFIGPAIGPIVSNFVAEYAGWRWVMGIMTIFAAVMWIVGSLLVPETYAPVILRRRARKLSQLTGKRHISIYEQRSGTSQNTSEKIRKVLIRPWVLLFHEPIVMLISVYMAILYATLFLLLGAFPVVFAETRGWSQGISGLPFIGICIGMISGAGHMIYDNRRYLNHIQRPDGEVPEVRLPPGLLGAVITPLGMFLFAWTNYPSIHWIVCLIGIAVFCHGSVLVFLSGMNYLLDSYTIFAASVLAANALLRAVLAAAFPLFTRQMYHNLGIHWASSIPAFLALSCSPAPFIFYRYGKQIRMKCKYAALAYEYGLIQKNAARKPPETTEVKVTVG
ncbi:hypothetical protein PV10_04280 [Exophiala mesophila]|uniref:Major facilitator superfamily (MFS) profile domain-containing protein n=1 Tax=Exophiala mesophila TaxID=212818 RepID=A0A0D1WUU9_EXOME|nr:uncharacterized protein PV10_04280 [Exophiala mesophila]KIV93035.1 hypothetical protein PV10_04280 [Exophiala mesophila]